MWDSVGSDCNIPMVDVYPLEGGDGRKFHEMIRSTPPTNTKGSHGVTIQADVNAIHSEMGGLLFGDTQDRGGSWALFLKQYVQFV